MVLSAALLSYRQTSVNNGFRLSGDLDGLQKGDSLFITTYSLPSYKEESKDTILVEKTGTFSTFVKTEHTALFHLSHRPKEGKPIESCFLGAEIIARVGDDITLKGSLDYIGATRHYGGLYADSLVAEIDSLTSVSNSEMIDIYNQILRYQDLKQNDSVAKYSKEYQKYRHPKALKTLRDSLALKVNDSEYSAFIYASRFMLDANYEEVKERFERFSQKVRNSYFGQIIGTQLKVLKNIEVGSYPADFSVVDKEGKEISLSDYRGKYLLIYHWGLCPGTFWVNPKIMTLYQEYHGKGLEVLGFTKDDIKKFFPEDPDTAKAFNEDENIQGLLKHPWPTVYTTKDRNEFIEDDLYLAGVPILMLISPDGVTLARGYTEAYEKIRNILEKDLYQAP